MLGAGALLWATTLGSTTTPAPVLTTIGYDVLSAAGGAVAATGTNLTGADACRIGDGTTWTTGTASASTSTAATMTVPSVSPGAYQLQIHTAAGGWSASLTVYVETSPIVWLQAERAVLNGSAVASLANTAQGGYAALSVAQATATQQPAYQSSYAAMNNRPVMVFDGVNDVLVSTALATPTSGPLTIYAVVQWNVYGFFYLFDDLDGTYRIAVYDDGASGGALHIYSEGYDIAGGVAAAGVANVWCFVLNDAASAIYRNDPTTSVTTGNVPVHALKSLRLGSRYSGEAFLAGSVGALAMFNTAHDATTRARQMGRLKTKYGIA